jgi:hypothetical protein
VGRVANDLEVAIPRNIHFNNLLPTWTLWPCCILNGVTCLENFGESGKNFIEIGKRPKGPETMLKLVGALEAVGVRSKEKQCRSANLEKATSKFRFSA